MFATMVERVGRVFTRPSLASRTSASRIGVRDIANRSASWISSMELPGRRTRFKMSSRRML